MMIIELTIQEYENKELYENNEILTELKNFNPKIFKTVLSALQGIQNAKNETKGLSVREYSESELEDIFGVEEFVRYFDEFYCEEYGTSVLLNFFVRDKYDDDVLLCDGYSFYLGGLMV